MVSGVQRRLLAAIAVPLLVALTAACGGGAATPEPTPSPTVEPTPFPTLTADETTALAEKLQRTALQPDDVPGFEQRAAGITTVADAATGTTNQTARLQQLIDCGRTLGWQQNMVRFDPQDPARGLFEIGLTVNTFGTPEGASACHGQGLDQLTSDSVAGALKTVGFGLGMDIGDTAAVEPTDYPGIGDDVVAFHGTARGDYKGVGPEDLAIDMIAFRRGRASVIFATFGMGSQTIPETAALLQKTADRVGAEFG